MSDYKTSTTVAEDNNIIPTKRSRREVKRSANDILYAPLVHVPEQLKTDILDEISEAQSVVVVSKPLVQKTDENVTAKPVQQCSDAINQKIAEISTLSATSDILHIQNVIGQLIFISKIQFQEKIDLKSMTICYNGWLTSLYRTFINTTESGDATIKFINNTIQEALCLLKKYSGDDPRYVKIRKLIIDEVNNCKGGLVNLSKTYINDRRFCSSIDAIMRLLDIEIQGYSK